MKEKIRTLMAISLCVFGMATTARNLSLDLSGAGNARMKVAYSQSAVSDSEEVRSHRLVAGAAKVFGLEVGDVIAFKLFEDKTLEVTLIEETEALTGRAFLGRIDNVLNALGCVVLETESGIILDVTDFENQRVWKVVSDENCVTVREIKPDNTRRRGGDTLYSPRSDAPVNVTVTTENGVTSVVTNYVAAITPPMMLSNKVASKMDAQSSLPSTALAATSGETTVDVLINYDTDAAAWARSNGGGVQAFAETCVQKMNTALANTGLTSYFRFRLVGVYEVGGSDGGDIINALYFASGSYFGTFNGVSWDGVEDERDRIGADIVCTLCDNGSEYGTVGVGWALMPGSDCASCGFNACQIRSVANSHTMTHEVGHNMGAGHGDKQADSPGPQYYTYSSGYYFTASGTKYHTIMAYDSDGYGNYYREVPYFSSPDYTYNGVAVGTATKNDNTRTLRGNWQMVAANRAAAVDDDDFDDDPPVVWVDLPTALDNTALKLTTGGSASWYGQAEYTSDGVDAARSGDISHNQESWMQTTVSGPGTVSFKWFVSSELDYDYLEFLIDDVLKSKISGASSSWASKTFTILTGGTHTLKWRYRKDVSYDEGEDAGFVDKVVWTPAGPSNDNFVNATRITGKSGAVSGSTVNATCESGEPLPSYKPAATNTIWWVWTAPVSGKVSFSTEETEFDTVMGVYTGSSVTGLTAISEDDDSGEGLKSLCNFAVVSGVKYYIAVSGYGGSQGTVRLNWNVLPSYIVKFNRMDSSGVTYTQAFSVGVSERLPTLQSMGWSYSGHYFMGWSTRVHNAALEPACVVDYADGAYVKNLASEGKTITLYAVWSSSPLKSIPSISSSASTSTVNATVDGVGFADADVKKVIGGSASVYSAFRTWAQGMTGGEAAVAISPHAAAAYLLGSNKLFGYEPTIILDATGGANAGGSGLSVVVTVKDGDRVMDVDATKVKSMFEATTDPGDWNGSSKLSTTVTVERDEGTSIRYNVSPINGKPRQMFIRILKNL
ncbi:MAG: hypothetical protein J6W10_03455 [Kiritimatiellae bacterium]|nr:hypothetical protein [Kiritimatiellia bacterium]